MTSDPRQAEQQDAPLEPGRAQRRRAAARNVGDDAPREGVAIFRPVERAVLVGLQLSGVQRHDVEASLDELELLVDTAGAVPVTRVVQRRDQPDVATFVGRGKVTELRDLARSVDADAVIFDDDLSPAQQRNVEERLDIKVLDRTIVILDIFAQHAVSREGKAQVELAQLTYLLPRLRGWGQSLSRQAGGGAGGGGGGGVGARRGPGETQLEVDRRKINRRITKLKRDLRSYAQTRDVKSQRRGRGGVPILALVGYTNAGKSTLLNALTGADALVADQLFATLDTTARRIELPDARTAVITDTVGFVKKLPTQLVEAFTSTLQESLQADLQVHVVDASHPEAEQQVLAVDQVLAEIGAIDVPRLLVLNKADVADADDLIGLRSRYPEVVVVSARTAQGMDELRRRMLHALPDPRRTIEALVPYERAELAAQVHREGEVLKEEHRQDGTLLVANVTRATADALEELLSVDPWSVERGAEDSDGVPGGA